jgi:phosphate transport system protein
MNQHLSRQFDSELDAIRASVTRMGGLVEEQVRAAMTAFADGDTELIELVIARDAAVDEMEVSIDEACTHIVARRQPTAIDLRLIMAVGKSVTDLERIGDEAKKIAKAKRKLVDRGMQGPMGNMIAVRQLGERVAQMLHEVLDAFVRLDTEAAARVAREDELIDRHFKAIFRQLLTYMMEDPRTISACMDVIFIAKSIERIGDHAKNIAEDVVYIAKGRDVRHQGIEAMEQETKAP